MLMTAVLFASLVRTAPYELDKGYLELREMALKTATSDLHVEAKSNEVIGVVVDLGLPEEVVTVAIFKGGIAIMLRSTGGYRMGGDRISSEIRDAVSHALSVASEQLPKMQRASDFSVIGSEGARVYVLTPAGVFSSDDIGGDLRGSLLHPNPPAYALAQAIDAVITAYRHLEPGETEPK